MQIKERGVSVLKRIAAKLMRLTARLLVAMNRKAAIVFESVPDYSDNSKAVYEEMIRRGYDKKYRLIWYLNDKKTPAVKARNYFVRRMAICTIFGNIWLPSLESVRVHGKKQTSFYLQHGTPLKSIRNYWTAPENVDYALAAAQAMVQMNAYETTIKPEKFFSAGFPRNDVFAQPPKDLKLIFGNYHKIIVWYPTYRQHKNHRFICSGDSMPLLHDEEKAKQLNEAAEANNVLLVIKPHFAQDVSMIRRLDLSSIRLIDDSFFAENGITSYEMLASSDALLTDYSSVYFDYTLRDRPIGAVWEDIEEYKKFPGLIDSVDFYMKGAEKIYTIEELCAFVENVAKGIDLLQAERREIRDLANVANDGRNTERVVDFIVEKAGL